MDLYLELENYENCEIESDLAAMIMPIKSKEQTLNNIAYTAFKAQLITKNNSHLLKAAPRTIPLTRHDRLKESNLRKYTYGKLNLNLFLKNIVNFGLKFKFNEKTNDTDYDGDDNDDKLTSNNIDSASVNNNKTKFCMEFDSLNKVDIDLNQNQVNINCDNEDLRVKVKDSLLKCLNVL